MKGQFYLIAVLLIVITISGILVTSSYVSISNTERNPQRISSNIKNVLKSLNLSLGLYNSSFIPIGNRDALLGLNIAGGSNQNDLVAIQQSAHKFLECADKTDRVSLLQFPNCTQGHIGDCNCIPNQDTPYLFITPANVAYQGSIIDGFDNKGKYPITEAVDLSGNIISTQTDPGRVRMSIMLITGNQNCAQIDPCEQVNSFPVGIPIYVINYKVPGTAMKCLAQKTGGQYFRVDTPGELNNTFCGILSAPDANITDFLNFVKQSISQRLLNLSFTVNYTFGLTTEILNQSSGLFINYQVNNYLNPMNQSVFSYSIHQNPTGSNTLVQTGAETINLAPNESFVKSVTISNPGQNNYSSIMYLNTSLGDNMGTNTLLFNYGQSNSFQSVRYVLVTYNITSDVNYISDSILVPVYIYKSY